jgi:hypothetical protein
MEAGLAEGFRVKTERRPERRIQYASEGLRERIGAKAPAKTLPARLETI